jgi:hypothetical protein
MARGPTERLILRQNMKLEVLTLSEVTTVTTEDKTTKITARGLSK